MGPEMEDNNLMIYGKRRTSKVWLEEDPNGLSYLEEKRPLGLQFKQILILM